MRGEPARQFQKKPHKKTDIGKDDLVVPTSAPDFSPSKEVATVTPPLVLTS